MRRSLLAAVIAFAFALVAGRGSVVAHAQDVPWAETVVMVEAPPDAQQGAAVNIVARLSTAEGAPIANENLDVNAGDVHGRGTTDVNGEATIALEGDIQVGQLAFTVSFSGSTSRQLSPSSSDVVTMTILPGAGLTLSIEPLGVVEFGTHPDIVVHATSASGQPQAGVGVDLLLNGEKIGRLQTDETGAGHVAMRRDLSVGTYSITAQYKGSATRGIGEAQAESQFSIPPGAIRVQTVPSLPDTRFALTQYSPDGAPLGTQTVRADDAGLATLPLTAPGGYLLQALPIRDLDESRGMRAEFTRWSDDSFTESRLLWVTSNVELSAGYDVTALVGHSFQDLDSAMVDKSLVGSVTLTSSLGEQIVLNPGDSAWLKASRVVRRLSGLESTKILYSVKSVTMDGSNVVNEYEQRFYAEPHKQVPITVSLYSMHIKTSDAIFGFPVGSAIQLKYTDGRTERLPLGPDHAVHLYSLPRGEYKVKVLGGGMSSSPPVALSRNQDVEIRVISYLDMALVGGTGIVIVVGLLAFGRGRLGAVIRRRLSPASVNLASIDQRQPQ